MRKYLLIMLGFVCVLFITACAPEKAKDNKGLLLLSSLPEGADVTVNSTIKVKKQTPVKLRLRAGTYLIKMSKGETQMAWSYVKVRAGGKTSLNLKLPALKSSVLIVSRPSAAKVIMNGKTQGITPLVLTNLKPGEYSAQIEQVNCATRSVKWQIKDFRPQKITVSLESDIGQLILKTEPAHAKVFINDKACGFTPFRMDLQSGRHNVKVSLAGFMDVKTTVDIKRDQATNKNIDLIHLPGTFKFVSNPVGSRIYINGKAYGKTPLTVADLPAGKYKIRIEKNAYDSITKDAHIVAGRVNTLEFVLERNTGGIDLIVNPPGVMVYLNGKKYGMVTAGENGNLSKVINIRNLPAGKYQIMLAHKRMVPATKKLKLTVRKGKITRLKPINLWVANAVLKVKNEHKVIVLLYEKNKKHIIYSPEPGVKIKKKLSEIDYVRPLTEADQ